LLQLEEALNQQARADQEHRRQRQFSGHERVAQQRPRATRRGSSSLLQHGIQIRRGGLAGRRQAEQQPRSQRDADGEQQDGGIHSEIVYRQQIRGHRRFHGTHRPGRRANARAAAQKRQQQALRQQLAQQAA